VTPEADLGRGYGCGHVVDGTTSTHTHVSPPSC
jgi:hypothetical protein